MKINKETYEEFLFIADPILKNSSFLSQKEYIQHGNTSVYNHCIRVALTAYKKACRKKKKYNLTDVVYGALLHDFFLYDWHILDHKNGHKRFHGFHHPQIAYINANNNFIINKKVKNIIRSHMWPLIPYRLPLSKEAWLICICDKVISIKEIFNLNGEIQIC